jgi:hypothetical protein
MKKSRILIILTLSILTTIAMGGLILSKNESVINKNIDSKYWAKRINGCNDKSLVDTAKVLEHSYDCLKATIWDAVKTRSFDSFAKAAEPIMANDIRYEYVCHIPGHDLGKDIIEFYNYDWRLAIKEMSYDLCGGGFVHGIYDVWGGENHPIEKWVEIGNYCWEAIQIRYSACADAIGHSGYESKGESLKEAMLICDAQNEEMIQTPCSVGAFMQAYFPQSTKLKKERKPKVLPTEEWDSIIQFCDSIPFRNFGAKSGCYYGGGWVIGNIIYFKMQEFRNSVNQDEFYSTPEMDKEVLRLVDLAIKACESSSIGRNDNIYQGCIYIMLARMPLFFYMASNDKFIDFCEKSIVNLPKEMFLECIASGHEHITPANMRDLMNRFEGLEKVMVRRGLSLPPA